MLLSDPSVARMTVEQWAFEAHALALREKQQVELLSKGIRIAVSSMRDMLISFTGADLVPDSMRQKMEEAREKLVRNGTVEAGDLDDIPFHLPLVMLAGNPDLLKPIFEELDKDRRARELVNDPHLNAVSDLIQRQLEEGDAVPIFFGQRPPGASPDVPLTGGDSEKTGAGGSGTTNDQTASATSTTTSTISTTTDEETEAADPALAGEDAFASAPVDPNDAYVRYMLSDDVQERLAHLMGVQGVRKQFAQEQDYVRSNFRKPDAPQRAEIRVVPTAPQRPKK